MSRAGVESLDVPNEAVTLQKRGTRPKKNEKLRGEFVRGFGEIVYHGWRREVVTDRVAKFSYHLLGLDEQRAGLQPKF